MSGLPARAGASSGFRTRLAVPIGWAFALAVLLPPLLAAEGGARGARSAALAAALLWWIAVVAVVRSDLREFIIPDGATAATAALGLVVAASTAQSAGDGWADAVEALRGALAMGAGAFAVFWLVGAACRRFGRDALGHGDVKLAGASAVWLSPVDAALALEMAALGAILALLAGRRDGRLRDTAVPFGAFLAPAAWLTYVLAPPLRDAGVLPW